MSVKMTDYFQLHHIGIIVKNLHAAIERYYNLSGGDRQEYYYEYVETQNVNICLVPVAGNTFIEFIEPIGINSPVYNFSRNGGGLHHLCYEVDNVEEAIKTLKESMKIIVKPVTGFQKRKMAFLFDKTGEIGVSLIEIIEKGRGKGEKCEESK